MGNCICFTCLRPQPGIKCVIYLLIIFVTWVNFGLYALKNIISQLSFVNFSYVYLLFIVYFIICCFLVILNFSIYCIQYYPLVNILMLLNSFSFFIFNWDIFGEIWRMNWCCIQIGINWHCFSVGADFNPMFKAL